MSPACFALAGLLVSGTPAAAQEIGVFGSVARSSMVELGAASGFGAFLRVAPHTLLTVRVGYHRHEDTHQRVGRVCNTYVVGFRCNDEEIATQTLLHGGAATAAWRLSLAPAPAELELGGGASLNVVSANEITASGRPSDLYSYRTAQPGLLTSAIGRLRPFAALPLNLEIGAALHLLFLSACAPEGWRYSPYCGARTLGDVRLGATWNFTR